MKLKALKFYLLILPLLFFISSCSNNSGEEQISIKSVTDSLPDFLFPIIGDVPDLNIDEVPEASNYYKLNGEENWIEYTYDSIYGGGKCVSRFSLLPSLDSNLLLLRVTNYPHEEYNGYNQKIKVFKSIKNSWEDISNELLPEAYKSNFYQTEAVAKDSTIVLKDHENKLESSLVWRNGKFVFTKELPENFGKRIDKWEELLTDDIKKEFEQFWDSFSKAVERKDNSLLTMIRFPFRSNHHSNVGDGGITMFEKEEFKEKEEQIIPSLKILKSKESLFVVLKRNLDTDTWDLPENQLVYQFSCTVENVEKTWYMNKFEDGIKLVGLDVYEGFD